MKKIHATFILLTGILLAVGCQSPSQIYAEQRTEAMETVKHLAVGCFRYARDNDGMLPLEMSELKTYVEILINPDEYDLDATGKISEIAFPSKAVLIRHKALLHGGLQAVAFADGHAGIVPVK
ncbi:MAG: hypothetical protein JW837_08625 [Sedimentisphaerales bacterium]|nr:hypothetical protein [Sedimentisphaerales bacterium]